jgi:hypothetical protein
MSAKLVPTFADTGCHVLYYYYLIQYFGCSFFIYFKRRLRTACNVNYTPNNFGGTKLKSNYVSRYGEKRLNTTDPYSFKVQ